MQHHHIQYQITIHKALRQYLTQYTKQQKTLQFDQIKNFFAIHILSNMNCIQLSINQSDLFITDYYSNIHHNQPIICQDIDVNTNTLLEIQDVQKQQQNLYPIYHLIKNNDANSKFVIQSKEQLSMYTSFNNKKLKIKKRKKNFCKGCKIYYCKVHNEWQKDDFSEQNGIQEQLNRIQNITLVGSTKCIHRLTDKKRNICVFDIINRIKRKKQETLTFIEKTLKMVQKNLWIQQELNKILQYGNFYFRQTINYCLLRKIILKDIHCFQIYCFIKILQKKKIGQIVLELDQYQEISPTFIRQLIHNSQHPPVIQIQESIFPKFYVSKSQICDGSGLYSSVPFNDKKNILQYVGQQINFDTQQQIINIRQQYYRKNQQYYTFFIQSPKLFIDAYFFGNASRFINHMPRSRSNVEFNINSTGKKIYIRSKRRISVGQELFIDYGQKFIASWKSQFDKKIKAIKNIVLQTNIG